jgi:hypothetical protein
MVEQTFSGRHFHALAHDAGREMLDRLAAEDLRVGRSPTFSQSVEFVD